MTTGNNTRSLNVQLIRRMYQDHDYTVEEIADRLRYPVDMVIKVVDQLSSRADLYQRPK